MYQFHANFFDNKNRSIPTFLAGKIALRNQVKSLCELETTMFFYGSFV